MRARAWFEFFGGSFWCQNPWNMLGTHDNKWDLNSRTSIPDIRQAVTLRRFILQSFELYSEDEREKSIHKFWEQWLGTIIISERTRWTQREIRDRIWQTQLKERFKKILNVPPLTQFFFIIAHKISYTKEEGCFSESDWVRKKVELHTHKDVAIHILATSCSFGFFLISGESCHHQALRFRQSGSRFWPILAEMCQCGHVVARRHGPW